MTDNKDPLEQLWLQQDVQVPPKSALRGRWRNEKKKQFAYVVLDFLGVLVGPFMLWLMYDKLNWFEFSAIAVISFLAFVLTLYIFKLRRTALNFQSSSTEDYIKLLKHQYQQNIKIALVSKYSVIPMLIFFVIFAAGIFMFGDYSTERLIRKTLVLVLAMLVTGPGLWIWADRRARYFKQELQLLEQPEEPSQ